MDKGQEGSSVTIHNKRPKDTKWAEVTEKRQREQTKERQLAVGGTGFLKGWKRKTW